MAHDMLLLSRPMKRVVRIARMLVDDQRAYVETKESTMIDKTESALQGGEHDFLWK